jgi:hypothetical protein
MGWVGSISGSGSGMGATIAQLNQLNRRDWWTSGKLPARSRSVPHHTSKRTDQESHRTDYPNEPTARAMTSNDVSRAAVASMPIRILARLESGIVSVGLKALEFVVDT